jgi:Bifunctional DNA primase/polymerase, N-terminal/AAA domain/Primase C terminal 1 (PriCT-1)
MVEDPRAQTNTAQVDAALRYARWGLPIFPVRAGMKVPAIPRKDGGHGFRDATCDEATVRAWFGERYPKANIGLATGKAQLFVVDVDTGKPEAKGEDKQRALAFVVEHGLDAAKVIVETPTGGRHYYFRRPPGNGDFPSKAAAFGVPLVDLKCDKGYVVVPPGETDAGAYGFAPEPDFGALTAPPASLLALLSRNVTAAPATDTIREGVRNTALTSLAGTMRRHAMDEEAIAAALLAENARRCEPPLPEAEVRRIAASVSRYAPAVAKEQPPPPGDEDAPPLPEPYVPEVMRRAVPTAAPTWRTMLLPPLGEFLARDSTVEAPLCGSAGAVVLPRGELLFLHGPPRGLKSWIALDLAVSVASGGKFLSQFPCERGRVVFLQADGSAAKWRERVRKVLAGRGAAIAEVEPWFTTGMRGGWTPVREGDLEALFEQLHGWPPDLLVLDPLSRFINGLLDENSTQDMARFVAQLDRIRQHWPGCSLSICHHETKAGDREGGARMRGSSVLWAAGSTAQVKPTGRDTCELSLTLKDDEPVGPFALRVDVDTDVATVTYCGPAGSPERRRERAAILQAMEAEKGPVTFAALEQRTGLTRGVLRGHVSDLLSGGYTVEFEPLVVGRAKARQFVLPRWQEGSATVPPREDG